MIEGIEETETAIEGTETARGIQAMVKGGGQTPVGFILQEAEMSQQQWDELKVSR